MNFDVWLAFVLACLVFSGTPGMGLLSTMNNAITTNTRYTLFGILGLQLALLVYVLIVSAGLSVILSQSATLFMVIKVMGACYLIWLGVQKWRTRVDASQMVHTQHAGNHWQALKTGLLVNFANPKTLIFLGAFFPQFINAQEPMAYQYCVLSATMVVIDIIVMLLCMVFASKAKQYIFNEKGLNITNKLFGAMFVTAGALMFKSGKA